MEILLAFDTAAGAIAAEHALLQAGLPVRMMNLPSAIRAGCGLAIRLDPRHLPAARALLAATAGAAPTGAYRREAEGGASRYTPVDLSPDF